MHRSLAALIPECVSRMDSWMLESSVSRFPISLKPTFASRLFEQSFMMQSFCLISVHIFHPSMSICRYYSLLTFLTFHLIYPRIMCSFISAVTCHSSYILERKETFGLSFSRSILLHSHLKSPFLLGCAHRSMSLPIHRVVRKSHDPSRYVLYT